MTNYAKHQSQPFFVFLTGASGTGKTRIARALEQRLKHVHVAYFDQMGIPPVQTMVSQCGSMENWQKASTFDWIEKLQKNADRPCVILEGSYNPEFAIQSCNELDIENY